MLEKSGAGRGAGGVLETFGPGRWDLGIASTSKRPARLSFSFNNTSSKLSSLWCARTSHFAPRNMEQLHWAAGAELRSFWLLRAQGVGQLLSAFMALAASAALAAHRNHQQSFTIGAPLRHLRMLTSTSAVCGVTVFELVRRSPFGADKWAVQNGVNAAGIYIRAKCNRCGQMLRSLMLML